ncbi:MAG: hypothetical protein R3E79_20005 [Caldilineaceae bacterium]
MSTLAQTVQAQVVRYVANPAFTQAILVFTDESRLLFEHSSRANRWARAPAAGSMADHCCQALQQFRLNAKHLQLYFGDGSDVEFVVPASLPPT